MNYLPHFTDEDTNCWSVLSMSWCVDFGGRQCQIECQRENGDGKSPVKTFVIYGKTGEFVQWSSGEVCDSVPKKGLFYTKVMTMFKDFDTTGEVAYDEN